jgi:hypothetical protein
LTPTNTERSNIYLEGMLMKAEWTFLWKLGGCSRPAEGPRYAMVREEGICVRTSPGKRHIRIPAGSLTETVDVQTNRNPVENKIWPVAGLCNLLHTHVFQALRLSTGAHYFHEPKKNKLQLDKESITTRSRTSRSTSSYSSNRIARTGRVS